MARKTKTKAKVNPRSRKRGSGSLRAHSADRVSPRRNRREGSSHTKVHKSSWLRRLLWFGLKPVPRLAYWGLVLSLWAGIATVGVVGFYAAQLPSADNWEVPKRPPNIQIVAHDGGLIGNRGLTGGRALRLEDMSPYILQAVIAIEDRRFHAHFGFDPIGFARAMTRNLMQKSMREGGSTITQQLAKNLFLTPDRTFGRKAQELILAIWLETRYSKAEILELYLNRVYFGSGATGVDAAARRFFGKPAKHVTIAEAALLAGLLKAPSKYSPARDPGLARKRAQVVLTAMQREGYITSGDIDLNNLKPGENARHFRSGPEHFVTDMIIREVAALIGNPDQDITVETTISPYLMTAANDILTASLELHGDHRKVSQAALVALAPDGALRALIGGRNYAESQFNRATDARRQPGSAFKTFVWLNAIERGYLPGSIVYDQPVRIGDWSPSNYDKTFRGPVTLAEALSRSLNTVSAQLTMEAGPHEIAKTAARLGVGSRLKPNPTLALGTSEVTLLELTSAYAPFANGGLKVKPYLITRVLGADGKILYHRADQPSEQVIDPEVLTMMNTMLTGVVTHGTGRSARVSGHVSAGKTGTSQGFRDALFVGHTTHLITGVWFGNDNNAPTRKVTGGTLPARAWQAFMSVALRDKPARALPTNPGQSANGPVLAPVPTPRPTNQENANSGLRHRVYTVLDQTINKTIFDLIVGN